MLRTAFIIDHIRLPQWAWDEWALEHECDANAGNLLPRGSWREVPCIRLAILVRSFPHEPCINAQGPTHMHPRTIWDNIVYCLRK